MKPSDVIRLHGMVVRCEALGCWGLAEVFRALLVAALAAGLTACSPDHRTHVTEYPVTASGRSAEGFVQGTRFTASGERVVDASVLSVNGALRTFFDYDDGNSFAAADLTADGQEVNFTPIGLNRNFTYVFFSGGTYFRFGMYLWDIFLESSSDGLVWHAENNGQPVLRHDQSTDSAWHRLWNTAVDIDEHGVWHLLAECSDVTPNQGAVGLCYATSPDGLTWTRDSGEQLIPHGGNPYLKVLPGGRMLIVHGVLNSAFGPYPADYWYVSASTCTAGVCATHRDRFLLGTPYVHDADPHLVETPSGGLLLVLSVDQSHITRLTAPNVTLSGLFDSLTAAL